MRYNVEANIINHSINLYYMAYFTNHIPLYNMKKIKFAFSIVLILLSCSTNKNNLQITSPDKEIELKFIVNQNGQAGYLIDYKNKMVIDTSYFGFNFIGERLFKEDLEIINSTISSFDETWKTVWGEQRFIRNNYNELKVELKEKTERGRNCSQS